MQFWLLVILLGALAGVLIPSLWFVLHVLETRFLAAFPPDLSSLHPFTSSAALVLPLGASAVAAFLLLATRMFRSADGFTYFISDLHFNDGRRKLGYSTVHGLASFALLAGGGVIGVEAFCFEFLSAWGGVLGNKLRFSASQVKTLTACGLTATVAALLGQPATALLFTIELLYGWGGLASTVGPFAITAFVAASVSKSLTTPTGLFRALPGSDGGLSLVIRGETFELGLTQGLLAVVCIGAAAAILAAFTVWLFKKTDRELHSLFFTRRSSDISPLAFAVRLLLWGAVTAAVFYQFNDVLGSGFSLLQQAQAENAILEALLLALLLRLMLGALSYSVLGSMGLMLPTLVFGAVLGSSLALALKPLLFVSVPTFALLGMGAYFSAAFGTPVAATALVYGYAGGTISENALFLFAALAVNFSAHYICGFLQQDRLASMGLYRHGIRFRSGMCFNTLSSIKVGDAMLSWIAPIPRASSIGDAYKLLMDSRFLKLPVTDVELKLAGMVSLSDFYGLDAWRRLGQDSQVHSLLGVDEIMKPAHTVLHPEMSLEEALRLMSEEDLVPVADKATGKYVGVLLKSDMTNLYNKEVVKKAFRR